VKLVTESEHGLLTPILIKDRAELEWPADAQAFYVLSGSGLFLCRQNEMFRSCVPVDAWPSELAPQDAFLEHDYPKVPRGVFAQLLGFFTVMAQTEGCEAGAYLLCDRETKVVSPLVPRQRATMRKGWSGRPNPIGLEYDNADSVDPTQMILGTVHSHVFESAFSSGVDVHDEVDKPGVHIVVGRLDRDPVDLHAEAVVDGNRFRLDPMEVIEKLDAADLEFPRAWVDQVEVVLNPSWSGTGGGYYNGGYSSGGYGSGGYGGSHRPTHLGDGNRGSASGGGYRS
jgi:proteasome lid subunit RPN8/RPN11